jgi:ABA4-like protein
MTRELILRAISIPVLAAWALMIVAPRARVTRALLHSDAIQLAIALVYAALIVPMLPGLLGKFDTLEHIRDAFTVPDLVLAGWIHYLAFDLFVGRAILGDAQRRGIAHAAVVPCLVLTLMLGPLGYLAYTIVRVATGHARGAVVALPEA